MLFHYPPSPRERRHGPCGYRDDRSNKPWLRDEFEFRCVYCLCRERWFPDGDGSFSVDHVVPRSTAPELELEYDNLAYACSGCNSVKQDAMGVPDPCQDPYGAHLEVLADGSIRPLSAQGDFLIRACRLDRPKLSQYRAGVLKLLRQLQGRTDKGAVELRRRFFGLPLNLPNLSSLAPPRGNARPEGIASSFFARKGRRDLPDTY
jgi:hypothetical protein